MGKQTAIKLALLSLAAFTIIIALLLVLKKATPSPDVLAKLQSQYQHLEITSSTFQGYEAKKASAETSNGRILLQVVEGVGNENLEGIMSELQNQITMLQEKFTYFDPYKGETVEYSIPEEFRPVAKEVSVRGDVLKYHVVYANEIFSYFVFSKEKTSFRGIVSIFNCGNNVYKIEIFSELGAFDENDSLTALADFYCP